MDKPVQQKYVDKYNAKNTVKQIMDSRPHFILRDRATGLYVGGMSADNAVIEMTSIASRAEKISQSSGVASAIACLVTREFPQFEFRAVQVSA